MFMIKISSLGSYQGRHVCCNLSPPEMVLDSSFLNCWVVDCRSCGFCTSALLHTSLSIDRKHSMETNYHQLNMKTSLHAIICSHKIYDRDRYFMWIYTSNSKIIT